MQEDSSIRSKENNGISTLEAQLRFCWTEGTENSFWDNCMLLNSLKAKLLGQFYQPSH